MRLGKRLRGRTKPLAFIITDVRYPNEAAAIKSWGGKLVKVIRLDAPKSDDVADSALAGFEGWDLTIHNDGTLDDLADFAYLTANRLIYQ